MNLNEEMQRRDYELAKLHHKLTGHIEEFTREFPDPDSRGLLKTLLKSESDRIKWE